MMLAATHGQIWNASQIGQSLGLSYHTINSYVDYLIGAFLIRLHQPYHANLRQRLVRSPKLYWRDSGLLHSLLNTRDESALLSQPWVGASWEGFVIEQILGALSHQDEQVQPFFFRTHEGQEIELVLDFGTRRWAVEIKLTSSPRPSDMAQLCASADLIDADLRILVSQTRHNVTGQRRVSCNLRWLLRHLAETL